jgi:serine protease Do
VALGVGAVTLKHRAPQEPPPEPAPAPVVVTEVAPETRTTQDISKASLPGTVSLRCEGSTGAGFFVGEELVLTNAHVACERGKFMEVSLADGRRVLGETLERDETLDLATVRVSGARAEPLPLGDSTQLSPGDRLVFIGSPKGLSFTVHEGKVSHLGREYLGVGYVQFDASINPGNSGGPLLNEKGEVVGVVSLKVNNAEGIGLALPIQYASKLLKVPATPESEQRWTELLTKVAREEERALRQFQLEADHPALVGLEEVANVGLAVAVVERFASAPSKKSHRFELQADLGRCGMEVAFERWRPLLEAVKEEDNSRRLRWLVSKGLAQGLYVGVARLPVEECALTGTGTGWLTVEGGNPELKAKLELAVVEKARAVVKARMQSRDRLISLTGEPMRERREQVDAHNREAAASWSNAFRQAQAQLRRLEEQRRKYAQLYATGHDVRGNLDDVDRELKRAREELDELEREASNAGIPREWRR